MKTTFKSAKDKDKNGANTHSRYDYKSTNYNNYNKPHHESKNYNIPHQERQIFVTSVIRAFQCKNKKRKDFCQNIKTYLRDQTCF